MAQDLTKRIIYGLNIGRDGTQVGILTFNNEPTIRMNLNDHNDKDTLLSYITYLREPSRETNIAAALEQLPDTMFTRNSGNRRSEDDFAILISDGKSTKNKNSLPREVESVRDAGIRLITVGINGADLRALSNIASIPANENTFEMRRASDLDEVANDILDILCG